MRLDTRRSVRTSLVAPVLRTAHAQQGIAGDGLAHRTNTECKHVCACASLFGHDPQLLAAWLQPDVTWQTRAEAKQRAIRASLLSLSRLPVRDD